MLRKFFMAPAKSKEKYLPSKYRLMLSVERRARIFALSQFQVLTHFASLYGLPSGQALYAELTRREHRADMENCSRYHLMEDEFLMTREDKLLDEPHDPRSERQILVDKNKRKLVELGVEFSVFEPTSIGLTKFILDATQSVRTHFDLTRFHNYAYQLQGQKFKIYKNAYLLTPFNTISSRVSLYRPETKSGDPRMWFKSLAEIADSGDQVAIVILEDNAFLLNLSRFDLDAVLAIKGNQLESFFSRYRRIVSSVAEELLGRLRNLAKVPFPSERGGSTGLGYTLEKLLGISANSSKEPDYKGIELKSGRGGQDRTTLFAQVSDWHISPCKSSAEILSKYGYPSLGHFRLYCTISALRLNPQGLSFFYDPSTDQLQEWHQNETLVAVWPGSLLRQRLLEKHAETFWVDAESTYVGGIEYFQLKKVIHTRAPIVSQLIPLIVSGAITMDHLIKRNEETNKVTEKGPLFKIRKRDLELLFPTPVEYTLIPESN